VFTYSNKAKAQPIYLHIYWYYI